MNIDTGIKGKRILLLGSCGVLGRTHAQILAEQKASLIIADRPGSSVLNDAEALGIPGLEIDVNSEAEMVDGV
jgi:NAD(P)-dependent dehydrogenase (short-subunit alcohol dehydrogenase family)